MRFLRAPFQLPVGLLLMAVSGLAAAQQNSGFYGGLSLRDKSGEAFLSSRPTTAPWTKYAVPAAEDTGSRTLMFGGYRWRNDIAVEAAVNTRDSLPLVTEPSGGVGLALNDVATKAWNVDLFGSLPLKPSLALYGRLGYGQSESRPSLFSPIIGSAVDQRRISREGLNYGVGLRVDVTQSLGLRMEYSRFGRPASSVSFSELLNNGLPETDQLSIGVQFKF